MVVFLNPRAGAGTAERRWARVEPGLTAFVGDFRRVVLEPGADTPRAVAREAERGETDFVAAGGDGTVNAVGSALLALGQPGLRLGAVGLGSSNDFHKPVRRLVAGVPVRVDFGAAAPRDVLRIDLDGSGFGYAFLNAAVGVTAEANHLFNHPTRVLARLKRHATGCAVLWAAVSTIAHHRPEPLAIDGSRPAPVANLAILLSTRCAGMLSYDARLAPSPGHATVAACLDMTPTELLRVVGSLARGRFDGLPRTRTWEATSLAVSAMRPVAVEADGEVFLASEVRFRVLPGALSLCP